MNEGICYAFSTLVGKSLCIFNNCSVGKCICNYKYLCHIRRKIISLIFQHLSGIESYFPSLKSILVVEFCAVRINFDTIFTVALCNYTLDIFLCSFAFLRPIAFKSFKRRRRGGDGGNASSIYHRCFVYGINYYLSM